MTVATWLTFTATYAQPQPPVPIVRYVDGDIAVSGNGVTWQTAYKYLQDALDQAQQIVNNNPEASVQLWVAATAPANPYLPDRSAAIPNGTEDRDEAFRLINRVAIYGGFHGQPGGETQLIHRRPEVNETVLSGDLGIEPPPASCGAPGAGACNVAHGTPGCSDADCCLLVCTAMPECCDVAWDAVCAFLVTNHLICSECGQPGSESCTVAHDTPGCDDPECCAIVCAANPVCCNNEWLPGCATDAQNCPTAANAYHVVTGSQVNETARLDGFTITGGIADGPATDQTRGGGIYLTAGAFGLMGEGPVISRCKVIGNRADDGGGLYAKAEPAGQGMVPNVIDCSFVDNEAVHDGGGAYAGTKSGGTWINCLFAGNTAANNGGGLVILGNKDQTLTNCTFSDNTAEGDAGGLLIDQSQLTVVEVTNSIFWANGDSGPIDASAQILVIGGGNELVTVNYSDVHGGWSGNGSFNINANPLFASPAMGNYRLNCGSPCIDSGTNASVPQDQFDVNDNGVTAEPTWDRDIEWRIRDTIVDRGAFEGGANGPQTNCDADISGDGAVRVDDLLIMLGEWTVEGQGGDLDADVKPTCGGDGFVNIADLLELLGEWSEDCEAGIPAAPPAGLGECLSEYSDPIEQAGCIEMLIKMGQI